VNEKSSLLNQLRIDRNAAPPSGERNLVPWLAGGGVAVMVIIAVAWFAFSGPSGIPVQAAAPRVASSGGIASGGSLLDASGYVVARRKATVSAKTIGKVTEVLIEEGQRVEKGQVIARLDDSNARAALDQAKAQVMQAEANVAAATAAYENAKPLFERNRKLVENGTISATIYENSKSVNDAARTNLAVTQSALGVSRSALTVAQRLFEDMTVRAPFDGVVTVKAAQPGEMISPNSAGGGFTRTGICTIVDMESLEVEVDVSENFISRVYAGQPATIKLNAYPDWQIPAEIIAVIPTADRAKATVQVRVAFKEKDDRVVPEMGARVSFLSAKTAAADAPPPSPGVIVPVEAVQTNGDNGTVYVIRGDKVERRVVRLGARNTDGQTILSGLTAAERVAIGDLTQLSDGARVEVQ
jgi:RND family efflux transporter MFP subunit